MEPFIERLEIYVSTPLAPMNYRTLTDGVLEKHVRWDIAQDIIIRYNANGKDENKLISYIDDMYLNAIIDTRRVFGGINDVINKLRVKVWKEVYLQIFDEGLTAVPKDFFNCSILK